MLLQDGWAERGSRVGDKNVAARVDGEVVGATEVGGRLRYVLDRGCVAAGPGWVDSDAGDPAKPAGHIELTVEPDDDVIRSSKAVS